MPIDQSRVRPTPVTTGQAILTGWLLCGVLDITAACVQAWTQAGRTPAQVLRGVASALWGRAAMDGGAGMAAVGLAMHFAVALTATLVFYALSRRVVVLRTAPLVDRGAALRRHRLLRDELRHAAGAVVATQPLSAHTAALARLDGLAATGHPHRFSSVPQSPGECGARDSFLTAA